MKKLLVLLLTSFLLIFLSACTGYSSTPIEPNENNMIITIKNNADFDFYGLEAKILNHSPSIVNADGSKVEKGQSLRFELLQEDVALDGKEIEVEVGILNDKQDIVQINKKVTLALVNNKEVFFELTGESINNAVVKRVE
jgi:hypothetical protein